jgi:hypothetical protein
LVPPIGATPLAKSRLVTTVEAAVTLPAVTVRTQEEQRTAFAAKAKTLPENRFAVSRHADSQAALDSRKRFVAA